MIGVVGGTAAIGIGALFRSIGKSQSKHAESVNALPVESLDQVFTRAEADAVWAGVETTTTIPQESWWTPVKSSTGNPVLARKIEDYEVREIWEASGRRSFKSRQEDFPVNRFVEGGPIFLGKPGQTIARVLMEDVPLETLLTVVKRDFTASGGTVVVVKDGGVPADRSIGFRKVESVIPDGKRVFAAGKWTREFDQLVFLKTEDGAIGYGGKGDVVKKLRGAAHGYFVAGNTCMGIGAATVITSLVLMNNK